MRYLLAAALFLVSALAHSVELTFDWDVPTQFTNNTTMYPCSTPTGGLPQVDQDNIAAGDCLSSFEILWGTSSGSHPNTVAVAGDATTTYVLNQTASQGTFHYYVIRAVQGNGVKSSISPQIQYQFNNGVPTPVVAPSGSSYILAPLQAIATCSLGTARYTIGGADPTTGSTVMPAGGLSISSDTTLKTVCDNGGLLGIIKTDFYGFPPFTSDENWQNAEHTDSTLNFEATPAGITDAVFCLHDGVATSYNDTAICVRLYTNGQVDAINGGTATYDAANVFTYAADDNIKITISDINFTNHTYDATAQILPSGPIVTIAEDYAFRSTQNTITQTTHFSHRIENQLPPVTLDNFNSTTSGPEVEVDGYPSGGAGHYFGKIPRNVGVPDQTFTIRNLGDSDLTVSPVSVTGANFTVTVQPSSPVVAAATTTFDIGAATNLYGDHEATVSFTTNDVTETTYSFPIRIVVPRQPTLDASPTVVRAFPDINVDSSMVLPSTGREVSLHNISAYISGGEADPSYNPECGTNWPGATVSQDLDGRWVATLPPLSAATYNLEFWCENDIPGPDTRVTDNFELIVDAAPIGGGSIASCIADPYGTPDLTINSLPLLASQVNSGDVVKLAAGTYTVNSGDVFQLDGKDNVSIDLNGQTIDYATTGAVGLTSGTYTGGKIGCGTLVRGSTTPDSDDIPSTAGLTLDHVDLTYRSEGEFNASYELAGGFVTIKDSEIKFYIDSQRGAGFAAGALIEDSRLHIVEAQAQSGAQETYVRFFRQAADVTIRRSHILVSEQTRYVNVISGWGAGTNLIEDSVIELYSSLSVTNGGSDRFWNVDNTQAPQTLRNSIIFAANTSDSATRLIQGRLPEGNPNTVPSGNIEVDSVTVFAKRRDTEIAGNKVLLMSASNQSFNMSLHDSRVSGEVTLHKCNVCGANQDIYNNWVEHTGTSNWPLEVDGNSNGDTGDPAAPIQIDHNQFDVANQIPATVIHDVGNSTVTPDYQGTGNNSVLVDGNVVFSTVAAENGSAGAYLNSGASILTVGPDGDKETVNPADFY